MNRNNAYPTETMYLDDISPAHCQLENLPKHFEDQGLMLTSLEMVPLIHLQGHTATMGLSWRGNDPKAGTTPRAVTSCTMRDGDRRIWDFVLSIEKRPSEMPEKGVINESHPEHAVARLSAIGSAEIESWAPYMPSWSEIVKNAYATNWRRWYDPADRRDPTDPDRRNYECVSLLRAAALGENLMVRYMTQYWMVKT